MISFANLNWQQAIYNDCRLGPVVLTGCGVTSIVNKAAHKLFGLEKSSYLSTTVELIAVCAGTAAAVCVSGFVPLIPFSASDGLKIVMVNASTVPFALLATSCIRGGNDSLILKTASYAVIVLLSGSLCTFFGIHGLAYQAVAKTAVVAVGAFLSCEFFKYSVLSNDLPVVVGGVLGSLYGIAPNISMAFFSVFSSLHALELNNPEPRLPCDEDCIGCTVSEALSVRKKRAA